MKLFETGNKEGGDSSATAPSWFMSGASTEKREEEGEGQGIGEFFDFSGEQQPRRGDSVGEGGSDATKEALVEQSSELPDASEFSFN